MLALVYYFFFQAEDGIRDLVRSRGLGYVYKRQAYQLLTEQEWLDKSKLTLFHSRFAVIDRQVVEAAVSYTHLTLPTIYSV